MLLEKTEAAVLFQRAPTNQTKQFVGYPSRHRFEIWNVIKKPEAARCNSSAVFFSLLSFPTQASWAKHKVLICFTSSHNVENEAESPI